MSLFNFIFSKGKWFNGVKKINYQNLKLNRTFQVSPPNNHRKTDRSDLLEGKISACLSLPYIAVPNIPSTRPENIHLFNTANEVIITIVLSGTVQASPFTFKREIPNEESQKKTKKRRNDCSLIQNIDYLCTR